MRKRPKRKYLPKDTERTTHIQYKGYAFGITNIEGTEQDLKSKYLVKIVHTWGDSDEVMNFGYDFGHGTQLPTETKPNPFHIVAYFDEYPSRSSLYRRLKEFCDVYFAERVEVRSG